MKFQLLFIPIIFLFIKIVQIESVKNKLQQKSFDEIFGEKWEEKEEKQRNELKKREMIAKYYKIKEKITQKGIKYSKKEWDKINSKIAINLETNKTYIKKWIKEFGVQRNNCYKSKTDEQKLEIVQKFIAMTKEYKQKRKYSHDEWNQNYLEICKKIGVGHFIIKKWKKQFGIGNNKITEKEKKEKMKIYWEIKKENPKISDKEIAEMINTSAKSIWRWKPKFGEENFQF